MVFRLAHSEYSNRHIFEASVQRRSWLRRLVLVTTLMMLAFSSSWVVLLALGGAVPAWLGCVSLVGSIFAMVRSLQLYKILPTKTAPRHRLRPVSRHATPTSSGPWIGRNILPVAFILKH